jgi:hypothetical protein
MAALVLFAKLRQGSESFSIVQAAELIAVEVIVAVLYGWFFIARPSDIAALMKRLKAARLAKGKA